MNDKIKFLKNLKQDLKIKISWNKKRPEIMTQLQNNNLDYTIDPTFRNTNRLFVLSFKNGDNNPTRNYFNKYYILLLSEILMNYQRF